MIYKHLVAEAIYDSRYTKKIYNQHTSFTRQYYFIIYLNPTRFLAIILAEY